MSNRTDITYGYGFSIQNVTEKALAAFILKHREVFSADEEEKDACDLAELVLKNKTVEDELFIYFDDYENDNSGHTGFGSAISNIMSRETEIGFTYEESTSFDRYAEKYILFPECYPWQLNDKEKELTEESLFAIMAKYVMELHLDVDDIDYHDVEYYG